MENGRPFLLLALTGLLALDSHAKGGIHFTGLSLGAGDWISVTDGDWSTREDYGTLPQAGCYFRGWGWNANLSLPLKSSFKRARHQTRYSLGDGEVSVARPIGNWSPRLSLKVPLYSWSVQNASENELFIGSGNVSIGMGLGGRLPKGILHRSLDLQFDAEASTVLTRALADYGSTHDMGVVQATTTIKTRWKVGVNALLLFDHWIWIPDYWDQRGETRLSIVSGMVAGVRLFRSTYVDVKAGRSIYEFRRLIGPKFAYRPQTAYTFGLSLYQGF